MSAGRAHETPAIAKRPEVDSFVALTAPQRAHVYAVLLRCLSSPDAALEVLGESALEVLSDRSRSNADPRRAWLLAAARRVFDRCPPEALGPPALDASPLQGDLWPDDSDALREAIDASLAELPSFTRAAVVLNAGGLDDAEIASCSGLEVSRVRRAVHAGRCALTRSVDRRLNRGVGHR
jgi:DNA-directed RNA polymerase specialized sigma24 family protein